MQSFYNQSVEEILTHLEVSELKGLTSEEAEKRLEEHGYNQLESKQKKTFLRMFLDQFKSFMILILLIASVVSGVIGVMNGEGLLDTFIILAILILNALIGAVQERKAEFSLEALKKLTAPDTKVFRDGAVTEVPTRELAGDIENLKVKSKILKKEITVIYYAYKNPKTKLLPKIIILFTLGYALSPIDLIPDFIPILGYLDDLLILPALISLSIKLIPKEIMDESRERADKEPLKLGKNWFFALLFILIWVALLTVIVLAIIRLFTK